MPVRRRDLGDAISVHLAAFPGSGSLTAKANFGTNGSRALFGKFQRSARSASSSAVLEYNRVLGWLYMTRIHVFNRGRGKTAWDFGFEGTMQLELLIREQ